MAKICRKSFYYLIPLVPARASFIRFPCNLYLFAKDEEVIKLRMTVVLAPHLAVSVENSFVWHASGGYIDKPVTCIIVSASRSEKIGLPRTILIAGSFNQIGRRRSCILSSPLAERVASLVPDVKTSMFLS